MTGLVGSIQNLIVEDREVEGKTQTNWVRGRKLGLGNLSGSLVRLEGLVGGILAAVAGGEFGKIAVVVSFPS